VKPLSASETGGGSAAPFSPPPIKVALVEDQPAVRESWIKLLGQGYANRVIADEMKLNINTVFGDLKGVFKKLKVSSRTEAVICYLAAKTPPPPVAGRWPGGGSHAIRSNSGCEFVDRHGLESCRRDLV
jgi:hypothetical protein